MLLLLIVEYYQIMHYNNIIGVHMKKFFGFIGSIIINVCFLYILDGFGYFSGVFKCYGETLELFYNIKDITLLKYCWVMLSDVIVIGSGLIVLFFTFDWIPNVLACKRK